MSLGCCYLSGRPQFEEPAVENQSPPKALQEPSVAPPSQANSRPWQANEPGFLLFICWATHRLAVLRRDLANWTGTCLVWRAPGGSRLLVNRQNRVHGVQT